MPFMRGCDGRRRVFFISDKLSSVIAPNGRRFRSKRREKAANFRQKKKKKPLEYGRLIIVVFRPRMPLTLIRH